MRGAEEAFARDFAQFVQTLLRPNAIRIAVTAPLSRMQHPVAPLADFVIAPMTVRRAC
jgi:hypothetical protein